jgi:hypothetical protein
MWPRLLSDMQCDQVLKAINFVGVSEIAGGLLLLLGTVISETPPWHRMASILVAFYAICAGIGAYKKSPLGYWLSLPLQVVQLFQIVTSTFLIKPCIGFCALIFVFLGGGLSISPGIGASLGIWGGGHGHHPGLGINLLAFAATFILFVAIKKTRGTRIPDEASKGAIE